MTISKMSGLQCDDLLGQSWVKSSLTEYVVLTHSLAEWSLFKVISEERRLPVTHGLQGKLRPSLLGHGMPPWPVALGKREGGLADKNSYL